MKTTAVILTVMVLVAAAWLGGCAKPVPTLQADPVKARIDAEVALNTALYAEAATTRARAIEALSQLEGASAGRMYVQALADPEPVVRFAAAIAIGDATYEPARARLVEMAGRDVRKGENDRRVYAGVLYALWRLGDASVAPDLVRLLKDPEWAVQDSVVLALGKMTVNTREIMNLMRIQVVYERQPEVKMRLVESMAMLGDLRSRDLLGAYTQTREYPGQDLQAIHALGKVGQLYPESAGRVARVLSVLTVPGCEAHLRLAAVAALADMGVVDDGAYDYTMAAMTDTARVISEGRKDANVTPEEIDAVRYMAALALGRMNRPVAVDAVLPMLQSESGLLRVAGALSILRLLPPPPVAPILFNTDATNGPAGAVQSEPGASANEASPAKAPRTTLNTADAKD